MLVRLTQLALSNFQCFAFNYFENDNKLAHNVMVTTRRSFYAFQLSLENIWLSLYSPFCFIKNIQISKKGLIQILKLLKPKFVKLGIGNVEEADCLEVLRKCNSKLIFVILKF